MGTQNMRRPKFHMDTALARYILRRLLLMIPVILGVIIMVFTIMYFVPGDPAQVILGGNGTDAEYEALRESLGLNRSYFVRLGEYLYNLVFHFDFGSSFITHKSITEELVLRFPKTLLLSVLSLAISIAAGIPLGVYAATHQNRFGDTISMILALIGTSMPGFWLALIFVLIFSSRLNLLPAYGITGWTSWILPVVANSVACIAVQARQTRSAMLDVLNSDYVVLAKSKGLQDRKVTWKHALPNALIPVITLSGATFANSMGGALVIETIFNIPGIGMMLVTAVNNRDYNIIQGGVIILAVIFSLMMLITDLIIAGLDPRVKNQFLGSIKRRKKKHAKA